MHTLQRQTKRARTAKATYKGRKILYIDRQNAVFAYRKSRPASHVRDSDQVQIIAKHKERTKGVYTTYHMTEIIVCFH